MRGRITCGIILAILLLPMVIAEPNSVIQIRSSTTLDDFDIGINTGAVSPDGEIVILVGKEGYVHRISAINPMDRSQDIELNAGPTAKDFNDVAWHPRGNTALITGDNGMALRYDTYDHSISNVNGSSTVSGLDLTSVAWRTSGDYAYFGAVDGSIWKFSEGSGFESIDNYGMTSPVSDIACHRTSNICVVVTQNDGIYVIGKDHHVTKMSDTKDYTWMAVDCADPTLRECVGFASGLITKAIQLNFEDSSLSYGKPPMMLTTLEGDITDVSSGSDGTTLLHLAPFGTVRQQPITNEAYAQLIYSDVEEWDAVISGRAIKFTWETSTLNGFIITDYGNIISFEPLQEAGDDSMLFKAIGLAVLVAVPGTIFGLIFMSSPFYQRMYAESKLRKVVGQPLIIALAIGGCSWALDNQYNFDTPLEAHFLITFAILFIGLWMGYSSERSNNKK
ncbi:MAG: WD40 repeat domain-containing protein [Candidatus Poseidoniaceae archaeon]|nr:WD40 repeat domain-containing protein [Candidatus Poseidoniaceae archaeon]